MEVSEPKWINKWIKYNRINSLRLVGIYITSTDKNRFKKTDGTLYHRQQENQNEAFTWNWDNIRNWICSSTVLCRTNVFPGVRRFSVLNCNVLSVLMYNVPETFQWFFNVSLACISQWDTVFLTISAFWMSNLISTGLICMTFDWVRNCWS